MTKYEEVYSCTQCDWTNRYIEHNENIKSPLEDFKRLIVKGLSSVHKKCPECGAMIEKSTKKLVSLRRF